MKLATRRLSIRAETRGGSVGSVSLELTSDKVNYTKTENLAPYALFGGEPLGNYFGTTFFPGSYTLKATSFTAQNLNGLASKATEVHFTLIENLVTNIVQVNAANEQDIGELKDGMTIDCHESFSIRAETEPHVASLRFILTRNGVEVINRVENLNPYTLLGDNPSEGYVPFDLKSGEYQLQLLGYAQDYATGTLLTDQTIHFTSQSTYQIHNVTFADAATGEDIKEVTNESRIDVPLGGLSIKATTDFCVGPCKICNPKIYQSKW